MKIKNWLKGHGLLIIILVATLFRLWKLGSIPPSLTPDEAALGYNAYSILKTGRDEYGKLLPIIFKSFGDYKPGLYVYLTVPFVAIFGLNEISVRLPSVLAGISCVYLIYLITKIFDDNKKSKSGFKLQYISALLLAINPWHIHFSRGAWEINIALTLSLLGIYYFLKSLENSRNLILSSLFFALTFIAYQGAKLSTLLILVALTIVYFKECKNLLKNNISLVIKSSLIGILIVSPIVFSLFSGKVGRLNVFSVFSYPRPHDYLQNFLDEGNEKIGSLNYYLYHPESLNFTRGILGRYFNHFSGKFLFFEGDWANPRHTSPNNGMMLLSDMIFIFFGLYIAFKHKTKITKFILIWLILSPLPAAFSRDQVHAVRAYNMLIPLTVLSSMGIVFLGKLNLNRTKLSNLIYSGAFILVLLGSIIYFIDSYYAHLPKHDSEYWMYGYKQIVEEVVPLQSKFKKIKVQQSFAQPYIYFLFYGSKLNPQLYDPGKYQSESQLVDSEYKGDVGYVEKIENIEFSEIDFPQEKRDTGALVVADIVKIPDEEISEENVKLIKDIKLLNGLTVFRVVEIL